MPSDEPHNPDGIDGDTGRIEMRFFELIEAVRARLEDGPDFLAWLGAWSSVLEAFGRLAETAVELGMRIPQASVQSDQPLFDEQVRAEIAVELRDLVDEFPDVGAFFFEVEHLDEMVERALDDDVTRSAAGELVEAVEVRIGQGIGRLIEWGLDADGPQFRVERLEAFIDGLEKLLDEILERWIMPALQDRWEPR
ncbi:MAG: hypothetical protein ACOCV2_04960 [Persicimonas sp.]